MSDIKAIETVFDGHRFRSRLEARWAVFFKEMDIKYEYELEGYELAPGIRYLPDFYLPEYSVHVEVKPHRDLARKDVEKIVRFAADGGKPTLLIVGTPTNEHMYLVSRRCLDAWDMFTIEEDTSNPFSARDLLFEAVEDWASVCFGAHPLNTGLHLVFKTKPPAVECLLNNALVKAKQARFEHGRSGN